MKVLITYASTGAGHLKAAQALYRTIKENCPGVEVAALDILEKSSVLFRHFYSGGYSFLVRYTLPLWQLLFWVTDFKAFRPFARFVVSLANHQHTKNFLAFLIRERFDCVVSTHFLPSEICACAKQAGKINSRLITVITDFAVHGFWVSDGTDLYVVATELTRNNLIGKGAPPDIIKIFGIPVDPEFLKQQNLDLLREKLHTDKKQFTVLIMTGSLGIGPVEEVVDLLHGCVRILVLCGRNVKLYSKLKKKKYPGVDVFAFVDSIPEMMSVSDCIITKPGGLTIAESLAKDLFPIFIAAIPGQEAENIHVLSRYGVGRHAKNARCVKNIILDFKKNPEKLVSLKENIRAIKKPDAAKEICHVVCQGCLRPAC